MSLRSEALMSGEFHPFTYCIGLEGTLAHALGCIKKYPLDDKSNSKEVDEFRQLLTLIHELFHLVQYAGTAFGLTSLRLLNIAFRYLTERPGWELPIIPKLYLKMLEGRTDKYENTALERFLAYVDVTRQLTITQIPYTPKIEKGLLLELEPCSPHLILLPEGTDIESYIKNVKSVGGNVHSLPWLCFADSRIRTKVSLTAATLMEAAAFLCEQNHIGNALYEVDPVIGHISAYAYNSTDFPFQWLPMDMNYVAPIVYAFKKGVGNSGDYVLTLQILIDLALMYDPFVLYDSPIIELPKSRDVPSYLYPGETFVKACEAAGKLPPLKSARPEEIENYYNRLCKEMSLPSPSWMAERSFEVIDKFISGVPSESGFLYKAFKLHFDMLKIRKSNPGNFPIHVTKMSTLVDSLQMAIDSISTFNINSGLAEVFDPANIEIVSTHNLVYSALLGHFVPTSSRFDRNVKGKQLECPLKNGIPFYCHSRNGQSERLCKWNIPNKAEKECLVDVYERLWRLSPPHRT